MKFPSLIPATFIRRLNRFVCEVIVDRKVERVLLRNTGRLSELLKEGRKVYVKERRKGKHSFELLLVEMENGLVCVDSHLPPLLLEEYLKEKHYPWKVESLRKEFKLGSSRFDLLVNERIVIETKSVNLVKDSVALFPDAPTKRGTRHVKELMNLAGNYLTSVVFVIQREDAELFSPNIVTDPEFSEALKSFASEGNTVKAFLCRVSRKEIKIHKEIPVLI